MNFQEQKQIKDMKKINLRNNELKELEQKFKEQIEYVENNIMKMELE